MQYHVCINYSYLDGKEVDIALYNHKTDSLRFIKDRQFKFAGKGARRSINYVLTNPLHANVYCDNLLI